MREFLNPFLPNGFPRRHPSTAEDTLHLEPQVEEELHRRIRELESSLAECSVQRDAAVQELEIFSYAVSHDVRAPLRAIEGFSRRLLEIAGANLAPGALRYLDLVRENSRQMGCLVDGLLCFSRLGRQPLHRGRIATRALVRQIVEEMDTAGEERDSEIVIGDLPDCDADPSMLRQVWFHLLGNALKYTCNKEGRRIVVRARQDRGVWIYSIEDNGVGFDMRYAGKLFRIFQRLHPAEEYEGTGIGLAMVQRIIQRHGGSIWARAEVNRGATFSFTLSPAQDSGEAPEPENAQIPTSQDREDRR